MAFHSHPQRAALTRGKIGQHPFGMFDLRQNPLRQRQQVFARLRQSQPATLLLPDGDAVAVLELADRVADRGLRQVQAVRSSSHAAQPVHLAQNGQMLTFKHA